MIPSTFTRLPVPLAEKNTYNNVVTKFNFWAVFFGLKSSLLFCKANETSLHPRSSIVVSFYRIDDQTFESLSR